MPCRETSQPRDRGEVLSGEVKRPALHLPTASKPGSRQQTAWQPACSNQSARALACDDFPDPSAPSKTMNFPDFMQLLQHVETSPKDNSEYK